MKVDIGRSETYRTFVKLTTGRAKPYRTLIAFATERFAVERSFHSLWYARERADDGPPPPAGSLKTLRRVGDDTPLARHELTFSQFYKYLATPLA